MSLTGKGYKGRCKPSDSAPLLGIAERKEPIADRDAGFKRRNAAA